MRVRPSGTTAWRIIGVLATAFLGLASATRLPPTTAAPSGLVTLSIIGTSDLHGVALSGNGLGGLPLLAGYVNNLRAVRAADGGAVLVVDSGDTFQGGIESNLSEGALIIDAYNAIGYTAEAVGNHDFDFGSVDSPTARQLPGDPRGALKARAAQAKFPFLAANLVDETTGRVVEWPNVRPSVLVDAAGVKVGVIGVMTIVALRATLATNVRGLRVAPPGPAIAAEASALRAAGARVVVVVAHAGGRCERFDQPADLSSCDSQSEIFQVARSLPTGLVDVIAAGHTHAGLAHQVNGIAIIEPFSRGQAFGRVDVVVDQKTRAVTRIQLFAPHDICAQEDPKTRQCVPAAASAVPAQYEGRAIRPDSAVVEAMAPALQRVRDLQATTLGVSVDAPIRRAGDLGSPLGNLFADALREAVPDADVAVVNNATRGLRADIPDGPMTFGRLYDVFPFDNRLSRITLAGAELNRWLAEEIRQGRRRALGISGVRVRADCSADGIHVELFRQSGPRIHDNDQLIVVTIGSPTPSGTLASTVRPGASNGTDNAPVVREVVESWLRQPHRRLEAGQAADADRRRWDFAGTQPDGCLGPNGLE